MGFNIGKAFKSATKAVGDTVKGAAKVTGKVFSSKVFNIATTAMCFIPGLNSAGLVGKALSAMGKASTVQKWLKIGLPIFDAIKNGKGLSEATKSLVSGKFQPLGPLSKFIVGNAPLFQPKPMGLIEELQGKAEFLKRLQPTISSQSKLIAAQLPVGLPDVLGKAEVMNSSVVKSLVNTNQRIHSASEMLQELQSALSPNPLLGNNYVVRC